MAKIKIITDSASDIPKEYEEKYNIDILCFPITVGDKSFFDRDYPADEYYNMIDACDELPVHSQLTTFEFEDVFLKYAAQGYTDIFFVSINSHGSATCQNACLAKQNVMNDHPEKVKGVNIRVLDSTDYSAAYGYPVIEAAKMAEEGKDPDEIESYLKEWFDAVEVLLACYTLRYVKKSGRVSGAAAFAGELIGLKPVILLKNEISKVLAKPRGEQNVVGKLASLTCERMTEGSPYIVIAGRNKQYAEDAAKELTKRLGYPPVDIRFQVGGAIAANSGPDIVATVYKAKK